MRGEQGDYRETKTHQVGTTEHMGIYGFLTVYGIDIKGFYSAKRRTELSFLFI
jgi:hypothetical protein